MKEEIADELVGGEFEMVFQESFGEEVQQEIKTLDKKLMRMYKMYADLERKLLLMEGNKAGREMGKEKFKKLRMSRWTMCGISDSRRIYDQ